MEKNSDEGLVEEEWTIKWDDLRLQEAIGEGSFGKVLKGSYFGTSVAVKKLFNHEERKMQKYIQRELASLKNIRHPNIVQFMGLCLHTSGLYIVTEYIPGGDLTVYIDNYDCGFTWKMVVKIVKQVAQAMAYLHGKHILHRDLKCSNLLVSDSQNWGIKVCDFGMARKTSDKQKYSAMTICGTDEYMAPEILMGDAYNEKADVFSFGLILFEISTRKVPQTREVKNKFTFNPMDFDKLAPQSTNPLFTQLLRECCQADPSKRPDFKLILDVLEKIDTKVDDRAISYRGMPPPPQNQQPVQAPASPRPKSNQRTRTASDFDVMLKRESSRDHLNDKKKMEEKKKEIEDIIDGLTSELSEALPKNN